MPDTQFSSYYTHFHNRTGDKRYVIGGKCTIDMCNESNNDKLENLSAYKIFVGGIKHAHLLSVTDLIKVEKKEVIHKKKT